ncbi:DUF4116 domain-containing protein [Listeria costaricensis]|uniref:DUF4116 domain-containing protein n=1 Tax=Listeria costaricensis TaxID=2026604 RepID=UPI000C087473|nr:DUF4116 domain-containing protein [Listeria costaricensis]
MMKNIELIVGREAVKKYPLNQTFSQLSWFYERDIENYFVLVVNGDLEIDGDLILDKIENENWGTNCQKWLKTVFHFENNAEMEKNYGITGLFILGDLHVRGSIINQNSDYGAALAVSGSVTADNLIAGGSSVIINRDAVIRACAYFYYNDGFAVIGENLHAQLAINDDHHVEYTSNTSQFSYGEFADIDILSQSFEENEDGKRLLPEELKELLLADIFLWDDLLSRLLSGKKVIKTGEIEILDQAFYDRTFQDRLQREDSSSEELLGFIPKEFRSKKICEQAVARDPYCLAYVPKEQITMALCEQAFYSDKCGPQIMEYVPMKFRTRALCMQAAKVRGVEISDLPEELQNDDELLLEMIQYNGYTFRGLPKEKILAPQVNYLFMLTALKKGSFSIIEFALQELDKYEPSAHHIENFLKYVIDHGLKYFDKVPGYYVDKNLFQYAESSYQEQPEWAIVKERHGLNYWQYGRYNAQYLKKIEADEKHEARYKGFLERVWQSAWTETALITLLDVTEPYIEIEDLPPSVLTDEIIRAIRRNNRWGYYNDYLSEHLYHEKE